MSPSFSATVSFEIRFHDSQGQQSRTSSPTCPVKVKTSTTVRGPPLLAWLEAATSAPNYNIRFDVCSPVSCGRKNGNNSITVTFPSTVIFPSDGCSSDNSKVGAAPAVVGEVCENSKDRHRISLQMVSFPAGIPIIV